MKQRITQSSTSEATSRRQRLLALVALVAGIFLLSACGDLFGGPPTPSAPRATNVTIEGGDLTLAPGATQQLTARVDVVNGAATTVTWSSSNTDAVTVTATGRVTAVAEGTATITATSTVTPSVSDSVVITVGGGGDGDGPAPTVAFTAEPATISAGGSATLSWNIEGGFTQARITDPMGEVIGADLAATGELAVTPEVTTTYTITVQYGTSSLTEAEVRVQVQAPEGAPQIEDFGAEVVPGSQVTLRWTATGGTSWQLQAIGPGTTTDLESGVGNGGEVTVAIPASATPSYRLSVTNLSGSDVAEIGRPVNVVVSTADYDPYDAGVYEPEPAIPGTLRAVLANAAADTVIGFASDIASIELPGIGFHRPEGGPNADAHLIITKNVVISGPAGSRITLQGASNQPAGDPSEALTWHSRMVFVAPGVTAELENLIITGGDFIVSGAGIRNLGTLTLTNVAVTGNRAFGDGGGIRNDGTLTIIDSEITDNGAFTADAEVAKEWNIRGSPDPEAWLRYGPDPLGNGGGIINRAGGTLTITDSVVSGNHAYYSGAGIYNDGTLTATGTDVTDNSADFTRYAAATWSYGGGIMNSATLSFSDGVIENNQSAEQGGGLWHGANANTTLSGVNLGTNLAGLNGVSGNGGGILQQAYTGELNRLSETAVTFVGGNRPTDSEVNDLGARPAGGGLNVHPLDYRMAPLPPRYR